MLTVRAERPEDIPGVRRVNELAFGRTDEAALVDQVRDVSHWPTFSRHNRIQM